MSTVYDKVYAEFTANNDVVSFIKFFSVQTWEKIGFVWRQPRLKMHEVTFTQNLLFEFRILAQRYPQSVAFFEAINENANGNDMELFIEIAGVGYAFFPCQAKIIYKGGRDLYESIDHRVLNKQTLQKEQQIESLLRYAAKRGGIPIYLFYNFSENRVARSAIENLAAVDLEVYGCSYINARALKSHFFGPVNWTVPSFMQLHPRMANPFYMLFEHLGGNDHKIPYIYYQEIMKSRVIFYRRPELSDTDSNYWIPVVDLATDERSTRGGNERQLVNEDAEPGFNPKYRIVINDGVVNTNFERRLK